MTVEERAKDVFDSDEILWLGPDRARLEQRVIQALRDQIEECAKIADEKSARVQSQNQMGWGMRSIADSISIAIRDLAESPPLEARIAKACDKVLSDEDALAELETKQ